MLTQRRIDRQTDTQTDRHTERQTEGQSDSANRNTENTNNVEIGNNKNGGEQHANMARDDGGNFYTLHIFTYENIFCKFLSLLQRAPGTPVPSSQYPVPSLPPNPLWSSSGIAALKTFMGFVFARHVCILYMRYVWKSTFLSFLRCSGFGFDSARLCAEFGGINGEWVSW